MVLIDFGIYFKDYASDFTRVLFTKTKKIYQDIFDIVKAANFFLRDTMLTGVKNREIQESLTKFLKSSLKKREVKVAIEDVFPHSWGHSLGLDVHDPCIFKDANSEIKTNTIVTIEPGLYFRKGIGGARFGIRFEDVLRVLPSKSEVLTRAFENFEDLIL